MKCSRAANRNPGLGRAGLPAALCRKPDSGSGLLTAFVVTGVFSLRGNMFPWPVNWTGARACRMLVAAQADQAGRRERAAEWSGKPRASRVQPVFPRRNPSVFTVAGQIGLAARGDVPIR